MRIYSPGVATPDPERYGANPKGRVAEWTLPRFNAAEIKVKVEEAFKESFKSIKNFEGQGAA